MFTSLTIANTDNFMYLVISTFVCVTVYMCVNIQYTHAHRGIYSQTLF